ncbi:PilC/PilY family type IV pilus protein [Aliiglaciecola sp. LCG003]|uniref:PilC/PilY family type IV pilus protein n=1 Tax=Aliiglaciecola sp. LCG003 TaxID=3053655 RepID=UPI00257314B4|nr:PilC/PilY family type IV pilus protein [Aliiglaciecola sp. LCG003]WJG08480.1 PilC/PilY family type IV pilus protein [Aliiglaciecola sp. LCG003]
MSINKALTGVASFLLSNMIVFTAFADDLEIYLGTSDAAVEYYPNVLFIMDTSGSMGGKDNTTETRMLRVQNALKETLGSVTNINAGLMRFSDFGGPVLYPVSPIDASVVPEIITPIVSGSDDAYEISGVVNTSSNQVKISQGTEVVTSGYRYQQLNIPRGAVITSAYMRFTSSQLNTAVTSINIRAELIGDATTFTTSNFDISSRTRTVNEINWDSENDWPLSADTINSPSIVNVIQEVVDQTSWCGMNALNIILETSSVSGSSDRRTAAFEDGTGSTPQLVIGYDESTATGCVQGQANYQVASQRDNAEERNDGAQSTGSELTFNASNNKYVAVRFRNLALPKNAVVTNAYLRFTAYQNRTGSGASFVIRGANEADPDNFRNYPRYLLRDKAKTSASVTWSNIPQWYRNFSYDSPSVASIVQELVNRGDWQSGNDMMFIMSNITGVRGAYSYQGKPSGAPELVVEYQGSATPGSISTVRQHLISKVDELTANGYTPIVDTLLEAAKYYGGRDVDYGLARGTSSVSSSVRRSTRVSHRQAYIGANSVLPNGCSEDNLSDGNCVGEYIPAGASYISPIEDRQCQTNNHIVLLSDGEANNNHSVSKIQALLGANCRDANGGEKCGVDLIGNIGDLGDSVIDSRIITHTIGFATNSAASAFLNKLAINGGGGFYEADNSADLVTAFSSILKTVKDVNTTFVSPGVAVNQLNRLTHNDELYFALFKPSEGAIWPGNLKKYRIDGDQVLDQNGLAAVDDGTGFFSENSHSYWSVAADGNDVREGGAASRMTLSRNIYTFEGNGTIIREGNLLHESNTSISQNDLGVSDLPDAATLRTTVLKWVRGVDVRDDDGDGSSDDVRLMMGDPIHSQPIIVNYGATESAILVATNHGLLHSFDPVTGSENFAVMPRELLANQYDLYRDGASFNHIYGLDGDMVLRNDGDNKYLYVGMRRGGNNYYAFDITSKSSPSLKFEIRGGSAGFEKLGQSWSRPTVTKVRIGSTVKNVLIFAGGYDAQQDDKETRSPDAIGNAVYIVDADTGGLLWSASNSGADLTLTDMQYSIPARVSVIDREGDGFADHMYVVDMGGQMFRLDIHNGNGVSELVSGGLMAQFAGESATDNRRFFYGPDVSEITLGDEHYYAVALGSGYRARPLNSVINDHFYMIKDPGVFELDANGLYTRPSTPISLSELFNATAHTLTSSDESEKEIATNEFSNKQGWYLELAAGGEKVLASPLIIDYQLFFTTYLPTTASVSDCAPPAGNSRAYLVNLLNANAVTDLDKNGDYQNEDRFAQLRQTGIAPETKILIEDIVKPVVCLGTECTSAVMDVDDEGNPLPCGTAFECLAENIYGRFERVQKNSWKTEIERQ